MKIAVIGATGMVGNCVTAEAVRRRHNVVAVSRNANPAPSSGSVTLVAADVSDTAGLTRVLKDVDVAVLSVRTAAGDEDRLPGLTRSALDAAADAGTRILVVGGAGPLRSPDEPDRAVVDNPTYVPSIWRSIAAASTAQLRQCEVHPAADWTYLSPPALLEPGDRAGTYRRGTDTLLTDEAGTSRISAEDLACAILDELEHRSPDRWFTVAEQRPMHDGSALNRAGSNRAGQGGVQDHKVSS